MTEENIAGIYTGNGWVASILYWNANGELETLDLEYDEAAEFIEAVEANPHQRKALALRVVTAHMEASEMDGSEGAKRSVVVDFEPQATINGRIVEVDPQGPTTFTVDEAEALKITGCAKLEAIESRTYASDGLKDARAAPRWIRQWSGPFDCDITLIEKDKAWTNTQEKES